ncbi:MAG TPA: DUF4157 domain-containing protein [Tepidisphaeraceae bacterium]|nr:DUF4157 domain-containing protein [Tepidisphaeraceae bacterium]
MRQLLPGHPFTVVLFDGGSNFLTRFREVWREIPLSCRRVMLKHWHTGSPRSVPLVEAGAYWSGSDALATVALNGWAMKFKPAVYEMSVGAARALIAHELAHVYQHATGTIAEWSSGCGGIEAARGCIEDDADDIAADWGFDRNELEDWKRDRLGVAA